MAGSICSSARVYLRQLGDLLSAVDSSAIDRLGKLVYEAWQGDKTVIVFGNGGSASTASHWVADLIKTASVEGQKRLRALSLSDNTGLLTAIGNDVDYQQTFVYQLESYARPGDIIVGISASGSSPNVVNACQWARHNGLATAAVTGFAGGAIGSICEIHINIPSDNYGLVEDLQLAVGHMVAQHLKHRVAKEVTA